jgi:DNA repair protein RecO (recombination protein O)
MDRKLFKAEAIVLASKNLGEADKIHTLYTNKFGRLSVISKGVRKLSSRKRGSMEVFNHIRFQAIYTQGMPIISEVEVVNDYENVRKSLKKVSVAFFFADVISKITREDEPNDELFLLLGKYLSRLEHASKLKDLRNNFTKSVLSLLGFWPINKPLSDPDILLEEVLERKLGSVRVGKKLSL